MTRPIPIAALLTLLTASTVGGCKGATNETIGATAETVSSPSTASAASPAASVPDSVVVYYFHGARRCRTCVGIQQTIKTTIDERFGAEIASGALVFREVNIDEPGNAHFVKQFDLSFSSMVVAAKSGETTVKWHNCDRIWPLAGDAAALGNYAEERIRSHLKLLRRT